MNTNGQPIASIAKNPEGSLTLQKNPQDSSGTFPEFHGILQNSKGIPSESFRTPQNNDTIFPFLNDPKGSWRIPLDNGTSFSPSNNPERSWEIAENSKESHRIRTPSFLPQTTLKNPERSHRIITPFFCFWKGNSPQLRGKTTAIAIFGVEPSSVVTSSDV